MQTTNPRNKSSSSRISEIYRRVGLPESEKRQLGKLCDSLKEYLSESQIKEVRRAYKVSASAHDGQRRLKGEKYIHHPLMVAHMLAGLHLDSRTIIAAILHDTLEDTELTLEKLEKEFGEEVATLVLGVSKVSNLEFVSKEREKNANLRSLFLAVSNDVRVILIKLADRIHNLNTLDVHRLEKRKRIARETYDIYIPIAYMLGMHSWRRQMEDLCFKAIYPKRYETINKAVRRDIKGGVNQTIKKHINAIQALLKERDIVASVSGRFKNVSAIHEKMRRKGNSLEAVQDLFAFRVVVQEVEDCYRTLGLIHNRYKPISGEFNDYIAIPKFNGYQSLHTTVHAEFGRAIEVQIRTEDMHRIAESGIASHLGYKTGNVSTELSSIPSTQLLNEVIHGLEDHTVAAPDDYFDNLKISLFSENVYVFTPKGDVMRLKKGATVVDFAYSIHTEVGDGIKSAKINGKRAALLTVLQNGDSVEVNSSKYGRPDPGWLQFAVTGKARMAIRHALKNKSDVEFEKMGKRLFQNALKTYKIKPASITQEMKDRLAQELSVNNWSAILYDIGTGKRVAGIIVNQIFPDTLSKVDQQASNELSVSIQGTEGVVVEYAKCCNPIPNDSIVGFFSLGRGIVIHCEDCLNVRDSKYSPEQWGKFHWVDKPRGPFRASIRLHTQDKKGVLAGVTTRIASAGANISTGEINTLESGYAVLDFDIDVTDREHLDRIMRLVESDSTVIDVKRSKLK